VQDDQAEFDDEGAEAQAEEVVAKVIQACGVVPAHGHSPFSLVLPDYPVIRHSATVTICTPRG